MSIGSKIVKGSLILIVLRISMLLLRIISTTILFRILLPEDFGLVASAMIVVGLVEVLAEFGFDQALIQNQNATRENYDSAWTLMVIRGICSASIIIIAAPYAAKYLHEPRLIEILPWLSLASLIDGFQNIGVVDFVKEMKFNKEFHFKLTQKIISFCITLSIAYWLKSYWALVIGILSGKSVSLLLSFYLSSYRPRFCLKEWRVIFDFSKWLMFSHLISYIGNQTDKILIQKYINTHTLGLYKVAEEISGIISELVWPIEKAAYPGFCKVADNKDKLTDYVKKSVQLISLILLPICFGLILTAESLVNILLGSKALAAIPFVKVLVLHGAIRSCVSSLPTCYLALNRPSIATRVSFLIISFRLIFLFFSIQEFGAIGAAWSLVFSSVLGYLMHWAVVTHLLPMRWWEFPLLIWRGIVGVFVMFYMVQIYSPIIEKCFEIDSDWFDLFVKAVVGGICYAITIIGLWMIRKDLQSAEYQILKSMKINKYFRKP
jgi:lipopolysaccharide exporter